MRKTSLNRYRKQLIKVALKNVTADSFSKAVSMIDKGVKWQLFHQNKAARMKSALAKQLPAGAKIAAKTSDKPVKIARTKTATTKPAKKTVKSTVKKSQNSNLTATKGRSERSDKSQNHK